MFARRVVVFSLLFLFWVRCKGQAGYGCNGVRTLGIYRSVDACFSSRSSGTITSYMYSCSDDGSQIDLKTWNNDDGTCNGNPSSTSFYSSSSTTIECSESQNCPYVRYREYDGCGDTDNDDYEEQVYITNTCISAKIWRCNATYFKLDEYYNNAIGDSKNSDWECERDVDEVFPIAREGCQDNVYTEIIDCSSTMTSEPTTSESSIAITSQECPDTTSDDALYGCNGLRVLGNYVSVDVCVSSRSSGVITSEMYVCSDDGTQIRIQTWDNDDGTCNGDPTSDVFYTNTESIFECGAESNCPYVKYRVYDGCGDTDNDDYEEEQRMVEVCVAAKIWSCNGKHARLDEYYNSIVDDEGSDWDCDRDVDDVYIIAENGCENDEYTEIIECMICDTTTFTPTTTMMYIPPGYDITTTDAMTSTSTMAATSARDISEPNYCIQCKFVENVMIVVTIIYFCCE